MRRTRVLVIGGGATGTGILRDLSLRGVEALLVEQGDLAAGTSSRFHGLLHSGARYAVSDPEAARECAVENAVLKRIGDYCVESTEGWFVLTPADDPAFAAKWQEACGRCGIRAVEIPLAEARRREPNLRPDVRAVFSVPDAAVDGFRLVWHNVMSARRYGGDVLTRHRVEAVHTANGAATGVRVRSLLTGAAEDIFCDQIVNATGSWAGELARLAGIEVSVTPDRGTLLAFNHRFAERVVNRLRPATDGDIFVPHGSITIFGTTSVPTDRPDDTAPSSEEVLALLNHGRELFPKIDEYRILRAFAGTRPLYSPHKDTGRAATRNFVILDHQEQGLGGMVSVTGGKFTSYRLMAEKTCDAVCARLGVGVPCRTAEEAIIPPSSAALMERARRLFPAAGLELAVARLGDDLEKAVVAAEKDPWKRLLLCECELVTLAEFTSVAEDATSHSLNDIRRRTRLGMGTCQGNFCAYRASGALVEGRCVGESPPRDILRQFLEERWHGIRPLLWGGQLREVELERGIYGATLNINGECGPEACAVPAPRSGNAGSARQTAVTPPVPAPAFSSAVPDRRGAGQDLIVVGAGLSGLIAAIAAARRGKRVLLISQGDGALAIGGGTVDLLGYVGGEPVYGDPFAAMASLPPEHPYRLLGPDIVAAALDFLCRVAGENGLALQNDGGVNAWLPTAVGTMKPVWLASFGMDPARIAAASSFAVAGITGMKDFSTALVMAGLADCPQFSGKRLEGIMLPTPLPGPKPGIRDASALDLARFMDTPAGFHWLSQALIREAPGLETILIPSILGVQAGSGLHARLEEETGRRIVELFCPPPSVTGLRLLHALRAAARRAGVTVLENATVSGAVTEGKRCLALSADRGGRYEADAFIVATGGLFSKGITTGPGSAREAIFGIPIPVPPRVEDWSGPRFFQKESHPFARLGVAVSEDLLPAGPAGDALFTNVRFVGRTLGGYDYAMENSGSGVALATGYFAGTRV